MSTQTNSFGGALFQYVSRHFFQLWLFMIPPPLLYCCLFFNDCALNTGRFPKKSQLKNEGEITKMILDYDKCSSHCKYFLDRNKYHLSRCTYGMGLATDFCFTIRPFQGWAERLTWGREMFLLPQKQRLSLALSNFYEEDKGTPRGYAPKWNHVHLFS